MRRWQAARAVRPRRGRGFTLIELIVALVVVLLVGGIAVFTLDQVRGGQQQRGATVTLSAAQVAARAVAGANHYTYPPSLVADLSAPGLSFTAAASTSSVQVSAFVPDPSTVVFAVLASPGRCLVMLDSLTARDALFGLNRSVAPGGCVASAAAAVSGQVTGTADAPSAMTF